MKIYCTHCTFECLLTRVTEEQHPGQYQTSFISDCCCEPVADWQGQPFKYGELRRAYDDQKSYEVWG